MSGPDPGALFALMSVILLAVFSHVSSRYHHRRYKELNDKLDTLISRSQSR